MRTLRGPATVVTILLGLGVISTPSAHAATLNVCPNGGASNTTYSGGLLVTGNNYCSLDHVTVNGGIVVDSGSDVDLESSTVHGGVTVTPGGEIEVGVSLFGGDRSTSTVFGGITLNRPTDWDIETARIYAGVTISNYTAPNPRAEPTFCGNTLYGGMTVRNASVSAPSWIGDPGDSAFGDFPGCDGNTIYGSLLLDHATTFEVEANRVAGSVLLHASTLELNGNHIGGSLLCSGATTILPGESPPDRSSNTVGGSNTC